MSKKVIGIVTAVIIAIIAIMVNCCDYFYTFSLFKILNLGKSTKIFLKKHYQHER